MEMEWKILEIKKMADMENAKSGKWKMLKMLKMRFV